MLQEIKDVTKQLRHRYTIQWMKSFKFVLVEKLYAERSEAKKILNLNYEIWSNINEKYAERSEAKKKKTEQLKEGLKSSILGPQNLGSGGGPGP